MNKFHLAIPMIQLSLWVANVQHAAAPYFSGNMSRTLVMVSMAIQEDEEDVPTDNSFLNWIAKLFLWFIYASLSLMILAGTVWSVKSKRVLSWVVCLCFAFFYAMLLGRYWGYTACLIGFVVLFSATKSFLLYTNKGRAWKAKHLDE